MPANSPALAEPDSPPRNEKFDRSLHRIYFRSSGINYFFHRRLRPAGASLGIILVLATCLAIGHPRASIYQLFTLTLSMMVVGLPWVFFRRAKAEATREVPRHATAGEMLRFAVKIKNTGRRNLTRAWLSETPPDPRPAEEDFISLREPGEEQRNGFDRAFAFYRWKWLCLRTRLFTGGFSSQEIRLQPGEAMRVFIELTPQHRGVIRLHDLRLLLPDPLGLFQRCARVSSTPSTLIVLPRRYPLPRVELPGGAAFKVSGEANTNSIGTSGEFVGLRDYRPGDPLRLIHWKSWARTGRPIVKELEDTFYPRYALVLDTLADRNSDAVFEDVVSVAASFAMTIDTSESILDLMFIRDQAHVFTAGRGIERAERMLEVLAGVAAVHTGDHRSLAQLVLKHGDDLTSCLVILNGWDESRADLLQRLERGGIICVPIIIGSGPRPEGVPGYWLESGHVPRDLMRLPARL